MMKNSILVASFAALAFGATAYAQSAHDHGSASTDSGASAPSAQGERGSMGMGMHGGQGMQGGEGEQGMHGMHRQGGQSMHGMSRMQFPPGYEKLELQMHAEMMESMARIMKKYAAKLPDKQ